MMETGLLTVKDMAALLRLSPRQIWKLVCAGRIVALGEPAWQENPGPQSAFAPVAESAKAPGLGPGAVAVVCQSESRRGQSTHLVWPESRQGGEPDALPNIR